MAIVIATRNQFILATKVHHMMINERMETIEVRDTKGRYKTIAQPYYDIYILYSPDMTNPNNNQGFGNANHYGERECTVTIRGKVDAYKVYKEVMKQIREQQPDTLFLDKAFENLLTDGEFDIMEKNEGQQMKLKPIMLLANSLKTKPTKLKKGTKYVSRSKKVRRSRKTKRTSKKVLRRPKRGNKRSRR